MRPSKEMISQALEQAGRMRSSGDDPDSLARCLLYLHQRNQRLEKILQHLEYFLQFGMPTEEHARLLKLVEEVREQDLYEKGADESGFGL